MKKFTETKEVKDFEVLSDTGWVDIKNIHTTIKYEVYEIYLSSGNMLRCADNHIVFNSSLDEIFTKDLREKDILYTEEGGDQIERIIKTGRFETMYDLELIEDSNNRYYTNGILSHNTQLAKELAKYMFGDADSLIRVDMSEYMEKFDASKLIGSPPGYVGHDEGGQLTEKVRRKPYSIILFDEVEKAHPEIFNTLLQVLDEGHLTDGMGRKINFKNTLIILTSNVGQRKLQDFGTGMGFSTSVKSDQTEMESEMVLKKELQKSFSPEFINRLDDMVYFKNLDKSNILEILDVELSKVIPRIEAMGYKIKLTQDLKDKIADVGFDPKFGARPLKRTIQKYIEDTLADLMVQNKLSEGCTLTLSYDKDKEETMQVPVKVKIVQKRTPTKNADN
jgi:ATP-dependent Clp protease ATP-binding subunit ClpC